LAFGAAVAVLVMQLWHDRGFGTPTADIVAGGNARAVSDCRKGSRPASAASGQAEISRSSLPAHPRDTALEILQSYPMNGKRLGFKPYSPVTSTGPLSWREKANNRPEPSANGRQGVSPVFTTPLGPPGPPPAIFARHAWRGNPLHQPQVPSLSGQWPEFLRASWQLLLRPSSAPASLAPRSPHAGSVVYSALNATLVFPWVFSGLLIGRLTTKLTPPKRKAKPPLTVTFYPVVDVYTWVRDPYPTRAWHSLEPHETRPPSPWEGFPPGSSEEPEQTTDDRVRAQPYVAGSEACRGYCESVPRTLELQIIPDANEASNRLAAAAEQLDPSPPSPSPATPRPEVPARLRVDAALLALARALADEAAPGAAPDLAALSAADLRTAISDREQPQQPASWFSDAIQRRLRMSESLVACRTPAPPVAALVSDAAQTRLWVSERFVAGRTPAPPVDASVSDSTRRKARRRRARQRGLKDVPPGRHASTSQSAPPADNRRRPNGAKPRKRLSPERRMRSRQHKLASCSEADCHLPLSCRLPLSCIAPGGENRAPPASALLWGLRDDPIASSRDW